MSDARPYLRSWLARQFAPDAWLWSRVAEASESDRAFVRSFAMVPRNVGKQVVEPSSDVPEALRALIDTRTFRADELARLWLLLETSRSPEQLLARVELLFGAADVSEQVTLYRGLGIFPAGELFTARAAEGVRSNMTPVFASVALDNVYPSRFLAEPAFNQLVVKALHVEAPLARILGIGTRMNAPLVAMLEGYASERRAAGRSIDPALFRLLEAAPPEARS